MGRWVESVESVVLVVELMATHTKNVPREEIDEEEVICLIMIFITKTC